MTYFIITTFINALTCSLCCIFILVNNFKSKTVKNLALFNITVALWSLFYFLSMLATHYEEALFYSRALNTIALFISPVFLSFSIQITENKNPLIKKLFYLSLILDFLVLPFVPTQYFIQKMSPVLIFPFWPVPGALFHLSTLEFFILVPLALYLMKARINQLSGDERQQLKIIYYSLSISFLGGSTNFFLCINIQIIPFGNALICIYNFGLIYSVFKYRAMNIHVALSRSFVYTIIIFLITLLYFTVTHITDLYLKEITGYKSFIFSFLYASITALAFVPLQEKLQRIVDKIFLKKTIEEIEKENYLLKQEVIQTEKLKAVATLASSLAHEIKNPLTVLTTFTEYLPKHKNDPQFLEQYGEVATKEIQRINLLVEELLAFSKPSPPQMQEVNPDKLVHQIIHLVQQKCDAAKIAIDSQLNANTTIQADPNQLQQALLNIILNAIDAMPNGGILVIASEAKQSFYTITISDTGCGIAPKDIPHIFEPFYTNKEKGTGLGLAITQGIIEKHGGKILVESKIGLGTTFILRIPFKD